MKRLMFTLCASAEGENMRKIIISACCCLLFFSVPAYSQTPINRPVLDWYIAWKKTRKYARLAEDLKHTSKAQGYYDEALAIYNQWYSWPPSSYKDACARAAAGLLKATDESRSGRGNVSNYIVLDADGDRCMTAAQNR